MPGARLLIEELAQAKDREGETELASDLRRIAERTSFETREMPLEVDALFVAHYAGRPSSAIVTGWLGRMRRH